MRPNNKLPFHSSRASKRADLISCPVFHAFPHCKSLWKRASATCLEFRCQRKTSSTWSYSAWLHLKERKKGWKNRRGNSDSRQRQELSPLVPRGRVNCLCPGSGDGVMMGKGEGGVSGPIRVSRRGKGELQGWLKSLSWLHTHTYTHTYCPSVSATADWGLTIHRKVNKSLSVLCRGLHCPLASHPCILHITHSIQHTSFLAISPPSPSS